MQEQEITQEIIRTYVSHLGVSVDSLTHTILTGQHIYTISTPDSNRLIGPQGEHLRALNFILRRYTERIPALKEYKFIVDVNGYHVGHIQDIEQKARALAEQVRTLHTSVALPPMNSYERMIIHTLFSEDTDIETESAGMSTMRHIILTYKKTEPTPQR